MSDQENVAPVGQPTQLQQSMHLAKNSSLFAQVAAALWIAGWHAWKFLQMAPADIASSDIVISGLTIAACFTPVYFNMVLDKIKGTR
jgi:hypothetical protein